MKLLQFVPAALLLTLSNDLLFAQTDSLAGRRTEVEIMDTVPLKVIYNNPRFNNFIGLSLTPLAVQAGAGEPATLSFDAQLIYHETANTGFSLGYRQAYAQSDFKNTGGGVGVDMKSSRRAEVMLWGANLADNIRSRWEIRYKHRKTKQRMVQQVEEFGVMALHVRFGYILDYRNIGRPNKGLDYLTGTSPLEYNDNGQARQLTPDKLQLSNTMLISHVIPIGFMVTSYQDIEVNLDKKTYKGKSRKTNYTEIYIDYLQGVGNPHFQDITYQHPVTAGFVPQLLSLDASKMKKAGFRLGVNEIRSPSKWFSYRLQHEVGLLPGPSGKNMPRWYASINWSIILGGLRRHQTKTIFDPASLR